MGFFRELDWDFFMPFMKSGNLLTKTLDNHSAIIMRPRGHLKIFYLVSLFILIICCNILFLKNIFLKEILLGILVASLYLVGNDIIDRLTKDKSIKKILQISVGLNTLKNISHLL